MKSVVVVVLFGVGLLAAGSASAQADLAKQQGCMNCHDAATKKVGPAFKDIAAKYKGKGDAEATLVAKITDGKDHPQVKSSKDDVQKLVKWILAM